MEDKLLEERSEEKNKSVKNGDYTESVKDLNRNPKTGRFVKGNCANPTGRPKAGQTIVEEFRDNPHSDTVIQNIYKIASTLGTDNEHPKAFECSKLITDKLIPTLKAQELTIGGEEKGFIYMPEPKESEKQ